MNVEGEEEEDRSGSGGTEDTKSDYYMNPKFRDVPFIYACATMWHENRQEMLQLMKSLFRSVNQETDNIFYMSSIYCHYHILLLM